MKALTKWIFILCMVITSWIISSLSVKPDRSWAELNAYAIGFTVGSIASAAIMHGENRD